MVVTETIRVTLPRLQPARNRSITFAGNKDFRTALDDFQKFHPHQGDIVIWDNSERTHSGILDEDGFLYYAGSRESETRRSHIRYYTGTPKRPIDFGAPTDITDIKEPINTFIPRLI